MEKKFVNIAKNLCIATIIALIGMLIWRSGDTPEENSTDYIAQAPPETPEEITLPVEYTPEVERRTLPPRAEQHVTDPYEDSSPAPNYIPAEWLPPPPPPLSPSDLQLAMFAHMAFFPFDFHKGERPGSPQFSPFHYQPFIEHVMTRNTSRQNQYGFTFADEMEGWHLLSTHYNPVTGFSITLYSCEREYTIVMAIRGSYGDIGPALLTQSGTWWCNFQGLAGYRHSHADSLVAVLNAPATLALLDEANIYITGHSLGGYLAYVAAYELVQMGFEDNIRRVVAFSAPLFNASTIEMISTISPVTRSRIVHYYVPCDLIAGIVGVDKGSIPQDYSVFQLTSRLLANLRNVRSIDIPPTVYTINNLMITVEGMLSINMPGHITELVWLLYGATSQEALELTNQFRRLVRHVSVTQTWHTPRPDSQLAPDMSLFDILRNYSPELVSEIAVDTVMSIFDTDTHFIMNFYPYLSTLS